MSEEMQIQAQKLEKQMKVLRQKLERSENNRSILEDVKDASQRLLKKVNSEVEEARATIERQNKELITLYAELGIEKQKSEDLLLNILPAKIADELKATGRVEAVYFESVTVIFTDIVGFTQMSKMLDEKRLVESLDECFCTFDEIIKKRGLEKIKTIGDSYMCAGGLPEANTTHPFDAVMAAVEIQEAVAERKRKKAGVGEFYWDIRLGIHTGPVTAGVVGKNKFAYDIWGTTVNTASRMESSGAAGRVNISGATYELVKDRFITEPRGKVQAKNMGEIEMYFVNGIKI